MIGVDELAQLEPTLRAAVFITTVAMLVAAERLRPRRTFRPWPMIKANVGLLITDTLIVRLVSTTSLVGLAFYAADQGWGVLNVTTGPVWLEFIVAVVILDLVLYTQHRVLHWLPWLWRLHSVHHADPAFDVTTGVRFHPGEILVSLAIKALAVLAIGASPMATLVFEILLSSASLFTHANVALPPRFETRLRQLIVTPEMHRVHHSHDPEEHNRNYGFLISAWDRLFGSYRGEAALPQERMHIGLNEVPEIEAQKLGAMLALPFKQVVH